MANSEHKPEAQLLEELSAAAEQVPLDARYAHYKDPDHLYRVVGHLILEEHDEVGIVYQAEYGGHVTYARRLSEWVEAVEWEGQTVPRFTRIAK